MIDQSFKDSFSKKLVQGSKNYVHEQQVSKLALEAAKAEVSNESTHTNPTTVELQIQPKPPTKETKKCIIS